MLYTFSMCPSIEHTKRIMQNVYPQKSAMLLSAFSIYSMAHYTTSILLSDEFHLRNLPSGFGVFVILLFFIASPRAKWDSQTTSNTSFYLKYSHVVISRCSSEVRRTHAYETRRTKQRICAQWQVVIAALLHLKLLASFQGDHFQKL